MRDLTEGDILNALFDHRIVASGDGWSARPADGGLNSSVYIVSRQEHPPQFVVRAAQPDQAASLRREARTLDLVTASGGCSQRVIAVLENAPDAQNIMLVLSYAHGDPMPLPALSNSQLVSLASCLAGIHAHQYEQFTIWPRTDERHGTRAQAFAARLQAVERYAGFHDSGDPSLNASINNIYQQLDSRTLVGDGWHEHTFSLLHGDLSLGNMIWDGPDLTLIDWEYTRAGDPAEDLAYLLAEQQVSEAQQQAILRTYVARGGDPTAVTRVPAYTALVALDSALWWASRYTDMGEDPGASSEVMYHLGRAHQALLGT